MGLLDAGLSWTRMLLILSAMLIILLSSKQILMYYDLLPSTSGTETCFPLLASANATIANLTATFSKALQDTDANLQSCAAEIQQMKSALAVTETRCQTDLASFQTQLTSCQANLSLASDQVRSCQGDVFNATTQLVSTKKELNYHLSRAGLVDGFCNSQVLNLHKCDRGRMKTEAVARDLGNRLGEMQKQVAAASSSSAAMNRMITELRHHREVFLDANDTSAFVSQKHKQVAVCLPGLMRSASLTYLSLLLHFFRAFDSYDIFVQTYIDNVAAASVFEPATIGITPTSNLPEGPIKGKLFSYNSGVQGYLKQLHGMSLCGALISNYSASTGTTYDWVVRARPDIFIMDRLPLFSSLNVTKMYGLSHDGYGGMNDKFFFGPYKPMIKLLTGLLPGFYEYPRLLKPEMYLFDKMSEQNMTTVFLPHRVKTVKMDGALGEW